MIRKVFAIAVIVVGIAAPAWASGPLIDNSTNASAGAAAISQSAATAGAVAGASVDNKFNPTLNQVYAPSNYNLGVNKQLQGQEQDQSQGQGQEQSTKVNNKQTIAPSQVVEFREAKQVYQAPTIVAPNLSAGVFVCVGSKSGGLTLGSSVVGVGGTFGSTTKNEECDSRADSASIIAVEGAQVDDVAKRIARARLCQRAEIRQAYEESGAASCPAKKGETAKAATPTAPVTVAPSQIFSDQTAAVTSPAIVQGN